MSIKKNVVDKVVEDLKKAEQKRLHRKLNTIGVYTLRRAEKGSLYGFPFYAVDDKMAMSAFRGMIAECPPLAGSDVYYIGTFCLLDGIISSCRPRVVLDK